MDVDFNPDDIGLMEEMLNKELSQRRTLENTLRMFNAVKFLRLELPRLKRELELVIKELHEYESLRDDSKKDYQQRKHELEQELERYKVQTESDKSAIKQQYDSFVKSHDDDVDIMQKELDDLEKAVEDRQRFYNEKVSELQGLVKIEEDKLETVKQEYKRFMDSIQGKV